MKTAKYEEETTNYNEVNKCKRYIKNKRTLNKTNILDICSFNVIIDWLNSLLICTKILNEYNIYEEIKDGVLILKLINIYVPEMSVRILFPKALKKKCALQNLEKALSIIYKNNPFYYSMVSSTDIYEKKKEKVNMLLMQLFDKFEFQKLKNISTPLLKWYNYTLKKKSFLSLYIETIYNPFYIKEKKKETLNNYDHSIISSFYDRSKKIDSTNMFKQNKFSDKLDKFSHKLNKLSDKLNNSTSKFSTRNITLITKKKYPHILKNFITYVLYKEKQVLRENDIHIPHIVKDFSNCVKIFFIFYRYGYINGEQFQNIINNDIRDKFFMLRNLLRKLNIPIILQNQYFNNPCEVAILLQLKYIQCFIYNNGYEKAIDLSNDFFFLPDLYRQKKKKKKKLLQCAHYDSNDDSNDKCHDKYNIYCDKECITNDINNYDTLKNERQHKTTVLQHGKEHYNTDENKKCINKTEENMLYVKLKNKLDTCVNIVKQNTVIESPQNQKCHNNDKTKSHLKLGEKKENDETCQENKIEIKKTKGIQNYPKHNFDELKNKIFNLTNSNTKKNVKAQIKIMKKAEPNAQTKICINKTFFKKDITQ
ncbi:conserved protein, unknown function [Hepatocystis sp. ex Piliocolobus tephrosceles]|nr:conserved protein, unknown function [Hepatocystis sp. ex Piliocolobus tephrosceles]